MNTNFYLVLCYILCFRYCVHQNSQAGTKAWYCCVWYDSIKCRATAVLHVACKTLLKVTQPHTLAWLPAGLRQVI
jgi:hypothetical protein